MPKLFRSFIVAILKVLIVSELKLEAQVSLYRSPDLSKLP